MDGVLVVDKNRGPSSREITQRVRELARASKAGHAGTLDPIATGVLAVCLDRATLLTSYLARGEKVYRVRALAGIETDTLDVEGKIIKSTGGRLDEESLKQVLSTFVGTIEQRPPIYSAVKHRGRPLYSYARRGVEVEVPPRKVTVNSLELADAWEDELGQHVALEVSCETGTYVRSLVHDIGTKLGNCLCAEEIRRLKSGPFSTGDAVTMEVIESGGSDSISSMLLTLETCTREMPTLEVRKGASMDVRCGKPLTRDALVEGSKEAPAGTFRVIDESAALLALYGPPRDEDPGWIVARAVRVIRPPDRREAKDGAVRQNQ